MKRTTISRILGILLLCAAIITMSFFFLSLVSELADTDFLDFIENITENGQIWSLLNSVICMIGSIFFGLGILLYGQKVLFALGCVSYIFADLFRYLYYQSDLFKYTWEDNEPVCFMLWIEIILLACFVVMLLCNLRKALPYAIPMLALYTTHQVCSLLPTLRSFDEDLSFNYTAPSFASAALVFLPFLCFLLLWKKEATPAAVAQAEAQPIAPPVTLSADPAQRIAQLDQLYMTGQIDEQEYLRQKAALRNQPV